MKKCKTCKKDFEFKKLPKKEQDDLTLLLGNLPKYFEQAHQPDLLKDFGLEDFCSVSCVKKKLSESLKGKEK